ncbi:heat shock protein Hsp20 [Desulfuromusa kysingii]|uniref:Heat shock protein Hsp20 n=1 Tax=Desulfuromusa kysingii TaxID=37625 RepID=A0A1H4BZR9_9BACT|nr:Hsp20/alpha crystallin family protein [Desulfuromusa kysingii]SEA53695.1 heat shock protein Hsp20 [Desulfuromusa kysingii]
MKLAKWDPFREMESMLDPYSRSLDWPFRGGRDLNMKGSDWVPRADISETDENFNVKVEVPGIKREDVKISLENHVLNISGENKQEKEEKGKKFHRVERYYGQFNRSFSLPENVDEEKIEAAFNDGLLTLTIPKTEVQKPKAIEIKVK